MIKLTQAERKSIASSARKHVADLGHEGGYGIDDAAILIEQQLDGLGRFDDLPYTEISDYAYGLARYVCPREAREN